MKIDILIGLGYKGGVENVVNLTAEYIASSGNQVRIIQMIWIDYSWASSMVEFHKLADSGEYEINDIEAFSARYDELISASYEPDIVFATSWPVTVLVARKSLKDRSAIISWMHGSIEACSDLKLGGLDELSRADAHLAINRTLARQLRDSTPGEVIEVSNPVDMTRIVYSENRQIGKLAFVGRLANEKNIPFLLNALRYASDRWTLDVIGDSDEDGTGVKILKEYCDQIGVSDRVTFHGWLDNPWEALRDSYALVLPSEREGSPLVAVEAFLCGMVVISTPTDGMIERIIPGENGYLFPFNDTESFLKILTFIEEGKLPPISPASCRASMQHLEGDKPLVDMWNKVMDYYRRSRRI
ncbi:MAG: glycosyltransferase [Lachnospiraceae bacterium]|nr:glycosyltransferase [Lachnospiraceae bacterium]